MTSKNKATPKSALTRKFTIPTRIKEEVKLVRYEKHWIEAVIDTVQIADEERRGFLRLLSRHFKLAKAQ